MSQPESEPGAPTPARHQRWRQGRRQLLIGAGATVAALLVGVPVTVEFARPRLAEYVRRAGIAEPDLPESPLVWFELSPRSITFHVPKIEMGQGIHTALARIAADELDLPVERLEVRQADPGHGFELPTLFTFGSSSVSALYLPIRQAAATVRAMLAAEASKHLRVRPTQLRSSDGRFLVRGSERSIGYLDVIAGHTGPWTEPSEAPRLKPRAALTNVGRSGVKVDMRAKLLGEAVYGYDARVDGMLYGAVAVPPRFGDTLKSAEVGSADQMPGVTQVVIDLPAGFAGVVADTRTRAWAALPRLRLGWQGGTRIGSDDVDDLLVPGEGAEIRRSGPVSGMFAEALGEKAEARMVTAEYSTPLAAHAHLEPLAALASVAPGANGRVEVWVPTQSPDQVVADLQKAMGQREVSVHVTYLGGSFGRKAGQHLSVEAARLSEASGRPVHVGWSRSTDLSHGFYRPPTRTRMRGAVGIDGRIGGIEQFSAGGDIIWAVARLPEPIREVLGFDPGGLLGQFLPYQLDAYRVVNRREDLPIPCGPWRGLGLMPNTFATESFIDELAEAAGIDPLPFRLTHLPDTTNGRRLRAVLERAARMAGWAEPLPLGRGRGIACSGDAETMVAQVAEVDLRRDELTVVAVYVAVDCGLVIDPAGATLQAQGSVVMALSSTLHEELKVVDGQVVSDNFDTYRLLRMDETPPIHVEFIGDDELPHGMGEPVVGPVAAAVANAVRAAGGPRLRRLPLRLP